MAVDRQKVSDGLAFVISSDLVSNRSESVEITESAYNAGFSRLDIDDILLDTKTRSVIT